MEIYLRFKTPNTYEQLKTKIHNGIAPTMSTLVYNTGNSQSIYQFNLNDYDFGCYGFPQLYKNSVCLDEIEPKIIGIDDGKGDFIEFFL